MMYKPAHKQFIEGMKTVFQVQLLGVDSTLAQQVSLACIERIGSIEAALSRYLPGSDVWQINHLEAGESRFIGEDCDECLRLALAAGVATGGLFDVTIGRLIEHRKASLPGEPPLLCGQLRLDPERPFVECLDSGREIDLGGIGKGFALDALAHLCREWGIPGGLLSAGNSTHLAFGPNPWEITLTGENHDRVLTLQNSALSASGTVIQGSHIVSPRPQAHDELHQRVWVQSESAALADAFSTAALLSENLHFLENCGLPIEIYYQSANGIERI